MAVKKSYRVMAVHGGWHLRSVKWQYILFFLIVCKVSDSTYNNNQSHNNFAPAKSPVCVRAI